MNSGTMKVLRARCRKRSAAPFESVIRAAGGRHHRMAGGHVPFAGRRQPGIDIDRAFGDPAEFDRRAEFAPDRAGPCGDEGFGPGIAMRAADRDRSTGWPRGGQRRVRIGSAQRLPVAERQPLGAAADDAAPDQPERGRADDAEQRRAVGRPAPD